LLEFALDTVPSFPVGRVEYLCLHPLDFEEYLQALNYQAASQQINTVPIESFAHKQLLQLFHEYAIIGGMPSIVKQYVEHKAIATLQNSYMTLWQSFKDDVEKYGRSTAQRNVIRHVMETAPNERDRVVFEKIGKSHYRSREVGEALRNLDMAHIIYLIYPTTSITLPIVTDFRKRPRLQLLDTGLLNQSLNLQGEMIGMSDLSDYYRGKIMLHLVTQQLIALHDQPIYRPHFWVREKKDSSAEVDLIFQFKNLLIPIEVKSGEQGKLRSLHQFVEAAPHPYAVRISANTLSVEQVRTPGGKPYFLMNMPYYLATRISVYIAWMIENWKF
jgi:uncharacterized protein